MNRRLGLLLGIVVALAFPDAARATDLHGKVVDAQTGEGIPRARITASNSLWARMPIDRKEITILTDSEGNFTFRNVPGQLTLTAQRNGYLQETPSDASKDVYIDAKQPLAPVILRLVRSAALSGRVTDAQGQALSAQVALFILTPGRNSKPQQVRFIQVDRTGEFRFSGLQPGRYTLRASHKSSPGELPSGKSYAHSFYQNQQRLESADFLELASGQDVEVQLALHTVPAFQIRGRLDLAGTPNFWLDAPPEAGGPLEAKARWEESTHTFTISDVPAGVYTIRASWAIPGDSSASASLPVAVTDSDIDGLVLTPDRPPAPPPPPPAPNK